MIAASLRVPLLWVMTLALAACSRQPASQHAGTPILAAKDTSLLRALALSPAIADGRDATAPLRPAPPLLRPAPAFLAQPRSRDDATRAAACLTAAVYYEARSEPLDGQRAVAQVVLNRVRDRAFPHSVCGVVFQGSQRRTGCQFSFTCDGSFTRRPVHLGWGAARRAARRALAGHVFADVGRATHYHTDWMVPYWRDTLVKVGRVRSHLFYVRH